MPSNFSRRAQRKKQTRLAFHSVEPSSSTTMSPARIRYQASSSPSKAFDLTSPGQIEGGTENDSFPSGKKYAVIIETPRKQKRDGRIPFKPLSTPVELFQMQMEGGSSAFSNEDQSDSELEILPPVRRQRTHQLVETQSPPSPAPTEHLRVSHPPIGSRRVFSGSKKRHLMGYDGAKDDSSAGSSPEDEEKVAKIRTGHANLRQKRITLRSTTLSDDDSGVESPLESPSRARMRYGQAILPKNQSPENTIEPKSVDMRNLISGGALNFSQKSKMISQKRSAKHRDSVSNFSPRKGTKEKKCATHLPDEEDAISILPTSQRRGGHGTRAKHIIITDDSEDPDIELCNSQTQSVQALRLTDEDLSEDDLPLLSKTKDSSGGNGIEVRYFENDQSEQDDVALRSSVKRRLRKRVEKYNEQHDTDEDEDDEDPISSPLKRRRVAVEDESESDPFISPSSRLRPRSVRQAEVETPPGVQTKRITRQRQRKKPHRTEREKKLELLKRQRAGEKITELTSSESDAGEPQHAIYDSNSDLEVLSEFEDEEKDENRGIEEVRHPVIRNDQNDDDDEFIVDDDDVPLGVPEYGLNDIPLQFTHHAHKPLKEHFKDVIEWMIQNRVNPAFNRKDPIYIQAFRKLDMEVHGYATSIYSSAVWKEAFTRALWARPVFLESAITPGDEHEGTKCDACGRTNHPATFEIQFGGKAYHKDTLDEVDNDHGDEEDDDDDSSSTASVNSDGQPIPSTDFSWFVGRFCRANAQTAHRLIHWKHALNEWVIDRLKSDGHLAPQKLAEREDWSTNKRSRYANRIVDEWEAEGEIKALYRDFKINLDDARQGKQTRWGK